MNKVSHIYPIFNTSYLQVIKTFHMIKNIIKLQSKELTNFPLPESVKSKDIWIAIFLNIMLLAILGTANMLQIVNWMTDRQS